MADVVSRPNGEVTKGGWTGAYTDVDDAATAPGGTPDGLDMNFADGASGGDATLTLQDPAIHSDKITIYSWGLNEEDADKGDAAYRLDITIGSTTYTGLTVTGTSSSWSSLVINGFWTPSDFSMAFNVIMVAETNKKADAACDAIQVHVQERTFVLNVLGGNLRGGTFGQG